MVIFIPEYFLIASQPLVIKSKGLGRITPSNLDNIAEHCQIHQEFKSGETISPLFNAVPIEGRTKFSNQVSEDKHVDLMDDFVFCV